MFTIYERVISMCADRGISVMKLEKIAGLANGAISKWKDHSPRIIAVKKVADALGCSVDDLLKGE